jgi:hypothetical protein
MQDLKRRIEVTEHMIRRDAYLGGRNLHPAASHSDHTSSPDEVWRIAILRNQLALMHKVDYIEYLLDHLVTPPTE